MKTVVMTWYLMGCLALCHSGDILSSQVFILPIMHQNFSFSLPEVNYRPSLLNMPDLASWIHYSYSSVVHTGFIYGVPPPGTKDLQLEVIATNLNTFEINRQVFDFNVREQQIKPFEVRFKITNLNVDELLIGDRWDRLKTILTQDLWPESSSDLVVTSLISASSRGDRMPLKPEEREGVYISFGSWAPFSAALLALEKESEPLWHHHPCPLYFKKTSYERFFRQKNFAVDWCSFKLFDNTKKDYSRDESKESYNEGKKSPVISALGKEAGVFLLRRDQVPVRSYTFDVIRTIMVPLFVMLLLLGLLTLAMCCHRNNMLPTSQDIQMVHYASVARANEAMRVIKGQDSYRDESPHPSVATTTTHGETLPHSSQGSRNGSPSSTLQRSSTPRRFEDYATLSRPNPPPYQRNGSTPTH